MKRRSTDIKIKTSTKKFDYSDDDKKKKRGSVMPDNPNDLRNDLSNFVENENESRQSKQEIEMRRSQLFMVNM